MTGSTTIRIAVRGESRYEPRRELPELLRSNTNNFFNGAGYQGATAIYEGCVV